MFVGGYGFWSWTAFFFRLFQGRISKGICYALRWFIYLLFEFPSFPAANLFQIINTANMYSLLTGIFYPTDVALEEGI